MTRLLLTLALSIATTTTIPPIAHASELPAEVTSVAEALGHLDENARVRMVNVWATWCAPCVVEMKDLEELHRAYGDKGLAVVGISMDGVIPGERSAIKEKVSRFLDTRSISFTNVYYIGKPDALMDELHSGGEIPVTILYSPDGEEIMRFEGAFVRTELEEKLRGLLALGN